MDMQVYIANFGKYNEGELVGDFELPFEIGEYTPFSEINRLCAMVEELEGSPIYHDYLKFKATGLIA